MRTLVVRNIHGCYLELQILLESARLGRLDREAARKILKEPGNLSKW